MKSFVEQAKMSQLENFRKRLNELQKNYNKIQKQFNDLCEKLDHSPLNEKYIQQISTYLTIYLSEMDVIDKKIEEISEIMKNIKAELSN